MSYEVMDVSTVQEASEYEGVLTKTHSREHIFICQGPMVAIAGHFPHSYTLTSVNNILPFVIAVPLDVRAFNDRREQLRIDFQ